MSKPSVSFMNFQKSMNQWLLLLSVWTWIIFWFVYEYIFHAEHTDSPSNDTNV
jgi:hypothetical protein